ncbi:MAG: exopolyphosphatase [Desulfovibrionaceae bacterium]|jgi:hypothetical protein|nr:exopolyphosphatase [Desulfovibrionaceae bacterium]
MRLVTRADFDGLCCAAMMLQAGIIDSFLYAHPKDVQDGKIAVGPEDVLANLPFVEGAGMWFDHHVSESARLRQQTHAFKGLRGAIKKAPSAARVVWDYFGGTRRFDARFEPMLDAVDRVDAAELTAEEIEHPSGWVLVGLLMDPRTGIGRRPFAKDHWAFLREMVDLVQRLSLEDLLEHPDVKERVDLYFAEAEPFRHMLREHTEDFGDVVVTDLRTVTDIHVGNRFLVYALYPACKASMLLLHSRTVGKDVVTAGHSILNRGCRANVGRIMLDFGGGGHAAVGSCQVDPEETAGVVQEILNRLLNEC